MSHKARSFLACLVAVASSLRLQPPLRHAARRRAAARVVPSASPGAALLEECTKGERDLSLIASGVRELEGEETPKKLKRALLGSWRLAFASDQESADMLLTGKASAVLAIEGVVLVFEKGDQMRSIEVLRPFGPFGNQRNALQGRWGLEGTQLNFRYTYLMDENNRREMDVPAAAKGTHTSKVTHASEKLLVLRRSEASYLLLEKVQLQDELENLRAADAPAEEGQKAGGAPPLPLPPLPKLELPKGLPKVELPKELPKLPKLPF